MACLRMEGNRCPRLLHSIIKGVRLVPASQSTPLTCTRQYFRDSGETYKITFPGRELYLMTSPEDISRIYKNTTELTFDTFIRETLISLGASSSAVNKWIPPRLTKDDTDVTHNGSSPLTSDFTHVGERLCQRQLLPGKDLDALQQVFMAGIHESLLWNRITRKIVLHSSPETKTVSLLGWCREVLLESATRAFFGDRLLQINPDLFRSFFLFDASSWKLNYGYPRVLSREMYAARDTIIEALTSYFKLPKTERPGAAYLIESFEIEMKLLDIGEKDIAALVMPVYWVYVSQILLPQSRLVVDYWFASELIRSVAESMPMPTNSVSG